MNSKFLSQLPLENGSFRHSMNLNKISENDWFEINDPNDWAFQLKEKRKLLSNLHDEIFLAEPSALKASKEVLSLVLEHLPKVHPNYYLRKGDHIILKTHSKFKEEQWSVDSSKNNIHPLDLSARLIQEDLVILLSDKNKLRNDKGLWHIRAGSVAFPSRWNLREKIGKPMDAIHLPVPFYKDQIQEAVNRFFDKMPVKQIYDRRNWSLYDNFELRNDGNEYNKELKNMIPINPDNSGERLCLRVERQTLRKLPISGGILFTIRIHLKQLKEIVRSKKYSNKLIKALSSLPPEIIEYKKMGKLTNSAIQYLKNH